MKKALAILLALIMCISMLTSCGKKNDEKIEDMPNPVKTHANIQEQTDATGIGLEAPEGASEVVYQSIEGMAETQFTYNGVRYFYRAESTDKTEAYDISGLKYTWAESVGSSVSEREAQVQLCDEAGFIMWLDIVPGINYNLGTSSETSAEQLTEMANAVFVPVQGDADEDPIIGLQWDAVSFNTCEEQAAAAGFGLEAPEGATDVSYQLISGSLVQTLFKLDGVEYFYRAQATGSTKAFDISGLYYDWTDVIASEVRNREATVKTCGEAGFIMWLDVVPGINYNLGTSSAIGADQLTALAEKIFVPVQDDDPGSISGMKNPVTTFKTLEEQAAYVGFGLKAPDGAKDVYYQAIGAMAQTLFTLDGVAYFYRAEPCSCTKEYDMSGLNYKWKNTTTGQVTVLQAVAKTCKEAGFIMWLDTAPGINYNLGTSSKISADALFTLAEKIFVSTQGGEDKPIGGMANPVVEAGSPEAQKELTGIGLKVPDDAKDIAYLTIKGLTETRFTLDGTAYIYRAMPTKSPVNVDISGLYYEWTDFAEGDVVGHPADVCTCGEAGFTMWLDKDNGIAYSLSVAGPVDAELLLDTANYIYRPYGHEDEPIMNMKNPVVSFESAAEQAAVLGYGLKASADAEYEDEEKKPEYHGIGTMAETVFFIGDVKYFFRAQPTTSVEATDISGLYCDWTDSAEGQVRGRTATVKLCDSASLVMWLDIVPGITYNLGTSAQVSAETLIILAEELFEPLQEDDPTSIIGGMENPAKSYTDRSGQFNALGFALDAPEGAENVRYQSINGMAETIFVVGGTEYYYRAEPTGALECYDMSGVYAGEWGEPAPCSVMERDGKILLAEDAGVIMWFDPVVGFNYNLSTVSEVDGDALLELANTIFIPLQGESE